MKGIILAGGTGSRLRPLTKVTNKHLLPVGRYPMIYWPLNSLFQCGLREIMIVSGLEHLDAIVRTLGSGADFDAHFTYRVQDRAGGIAEALGLCRQFANGGSMMVVLGDNIFLGDLAPLVEDFEAGGRVLLSESETPERFGVAELGEEGMVTRIVEKPSEPPSNWVVTGCYLYDARVFDIIEGLEPSERGELEITDVNNAYIERGEMEFRKIDFPWTDAGTFESLQRANDLAGRGKLEYVPEPDGGGSAA
jgi:glucose-1-phosphate thymidylyltransferase